MITSIPAVEPHPCRSKFQQFQIDKLPPIDRYFPSMAQHFDPYFDLQVLGLKTVLSNAHNKNTEKLLQDYLTFIPDLGHFGKLDISVLKAKFKDNIQLLVTIASNNEFEYL